MSILLVDFFIFAKVFNKLRLIKREKVDDIIIYIFVFIKERYDIKYLSIIFK